MDEFDVNYKLNLRESKGVQVGDYNQQNNIFNILYEEDSEEESYKNFKFRDDSPYQGLTQFTADDSGRFYGRNKLKEDLFNNLMEKNLLILLGASGSGKSSLVKAGLIPKFSKEYKGSFVRFDLVPSESPFFSFYGQIISFISTNTKQYKQSDAQVALPPSKIDTDEDLQSALNLLVRVVTSLKKSSGSMWLIFIDQFEEIFTRTSEFERGLFIGSLRSLIDYLRESRDKSVKIVLAMRTDFLDRLMNEFPDFVLAIQDGGKEPFSYITPMTDRELKLVIKNPAATHGVNVERDLIEEVINDFRGESRSLPLLQYTLDLLWKSDDLSDTLLNKETYESLGCVGGALQQQAEKIYQQYEDQGQGKLVEDIFWNLVTITGDGKRVSKREDKSRFINMGGEAIVNELIQEHRLLISGRQTGTVEIAHEALISSWSRLQGWINTHEEKIILERQLREAAEGWAKFKNDVQKASGELWIGSKLERIFELRVFGLTEGNSSSDLPQNDFKKTIEAFVQESLQLRDQEKRKLEIALTESRLREKAARVLNLLPTQPLDALVLAVQTMGDNVDKIPENLLTPVQFSLNKAMTDIRVSKIVGKHQDYVNSVAISPDSKMIVSGSNDGKVQLWDLEGYPIGQSFQGHKGAVWSVAFSPDSKMIVSGSHDETVRLWDLEGNPPIEQLFQEHKDTVWSVAISPDSKMIVSGSNDGKVQLWNLEGNLIGQSFQGHKDAVWSVAFSPNSKMIVSGSHDETVRLWDLEGNPIRQPFQGHKLYVRSVAFSPDGKYIVSGSNDKTVRLWDLEGNLIGQPFQGHQGYVCSVAFSPDSKHIISGSYDKTIRLWDLEGNLIGQPFQGHQDYVRSVAFSPDGKYIVSGSNDKTVRLWDLEGNLIGQPFQGHQEHFRSVAFSPDGKHIVSVSRSHDKTVQLWDLEGKLIEQPFYENESFGNLATFSWDGDEIIVCGSGDKKVRLLDLEKNAIGQPYAVTSVAFSPNGEYIISGSENKTVRLWDLKGNPIRQSFQGHEDAVTSVAFSPDTKMIISGSKDQTVRLWNLQGKSIVQPFQGHKDAVWSVAISPNGKMIVSGSGDKTVRLWDLEGNPIGQPFQGHEYPVTSVAFSPDGKMIVSRSTDGKMCLWHGHWTEWLRMCCNRLKHFFTFQNPQTEGENQAKATAEKYIFNPQIGAKELYDKSTRCIQEKDFTTAITLLDHAVSCYPAYTQAYYQRGVAYYQTKLYLDAIKDFDQVSTSQPKLASAYHYRGICYGQISELKRAKADLQQAIQIYRQQSKQKEAQRVQELLRKLLQ